MLKILIETIPHSGQAYDTCGNYWVDDDGTFHIVISEMENMDYEFAVAIHEMFEQYLCFRRGISEEVITAFDIDYEANRQKGDVSEPGDDQTAPYQNEHCLATAIERMTIATLGKKWRDYEKAVLGLSK